MPTKILTPLIIFTGIFFIASFKSPESWQSGFVKLDKDGSLEYIPDEKGNILPDFSQVGYYGGNKTIPDIAVVKTISATERNSEEIIQSAIDEVSKRTPDKNGFRGAILFKKGSYKIPGTIKIEAAGIILRGEGNDTKLIATGTTQRPLINVSGKGTLEEIPNTRTKIIDDYVVVGAKSFTVTSAQGFKAGDKIIVYRPGTEQWVSDLKMDRIEERNGTKQWKPAEYNLSFERMITKIEGNKIFIDNSIVLAMETKYGGGEIFKYKFDGRINNVGIENLYCESEFETDTSENHGWDAIHFDKSKMAGCGTLPQNILVIAA